MIRFILNPPDRDKRNVQVGILHRTEDGYKLSADGQTIKEQLPLRDFVMRTMGRQPYTDRDLDSRMYDIIRSTDLTSPEFSDSRATRLAEMYDHRYSRMIRDGEIVLAEHKMGMINHRESISNTERSVTQSIDPRIHRSDLDHQEWDHKRVTDYMRQTGMYPTNAMQEQRNRQKIERPLTTVDSYKAIDNDVYYLLTTPS